MPTAGFDDLATLDGVLQGPHRGRGGRVFQAHQDGVARIEPGFFRERVVGNVAPLIQWTDTDVRPKDTGYLYRVQVQDSCGNGSIVSNVGSNIVLRASSSLTGENILEWNGYIQWAGMIGSHDIYRSIDDGACAGP